MCRSIFWMRVLYLFLNVINRTHHEDRRTAHGSGVIKSLRLRRGVIVGVQLHGSTRSYFLQKRLVEWRMKDRLMLARQKSSDMTCTETVVLLTRWSITSNFIRRVWRFLRWEKAVVDDNTRRDVGSKKSTCRHKIGGFTKLSFDHHSYAFAEDDLHK